MPLAPIQYNASKKWLIHTSSWIICILYFLVVYGLLWWAKIPYEVRLIDGITSALAITGMSYLTYSSLQFYLPKKRQYWKLFSIALMFSFISVLLTRYMLLSLLTPEETNYLTFSLPFRWVINFLIVVCIMTVNIFWNIQEEYEENKNRKEQSERMMRDAELYNLRQQLQPHFLFNSLNSLIALIGKKPAEARHMTFQLSDFLRGTMRKDEKQFIPLEDELSHLRLYLDIEKVRFGHRLRTEFDYGDDVLSAKVPVMIIQPLVENAIKFGLYNVTGDVTIRIEARRNEHLLTIRITNPYDPEQFNKKKGTGFGLSSIQRRLYLLFSRTDLLQTQTQENIFISTLKIPQIATNNEN